ncbi:MAG: SRPBCC family protein [Deltaproteobacteria bacterium]|nr:SRPBCC family protein [Deltaproteobacteria bacterium]
MAQASQKSDSLYFKKLEDWKIVVESSLDKNHEYNAKAEGLIRADPEQVWAVLIDFNNWKSIFPHLPVSSEIPPETAVQLKELAQTGNIPPEVLEAWRVRLDKAKTNNGPWWMRHMGQVWDGYLFEVYDFPWPVTNRWSVNQLTMDERARDQKQYQLNWQMLVGTFRVSHGFFKLEPYSRNPSLSHLRMTLVNDPGLHVPQPLINLGSHMSLPNVIRGIRRAAEGQK